MEYNLRNIYYMPKLYKLPAVKESLYHPKLPTFRRMDIDTAAHKLPDEHCRTTSMFEGGRYRTLHFCNFFFHNYSNSVILILFVKNKQK